MIQMTQEELAEVRLALAARARSNPCGSEPHQVCVGLLDKLQPERAQTEPNLTVPQVAFDTEEYVESWH
jgi:hypothetical protein